MKRVIQLIPINISVQDISIAPQELGCNVIGFEQMRPNALHVGVRSSYIPASEVTFTCCCKSQSTYILTKIFHIFMKVEAYRAQTVVTPCFNCHLKKMLALRVAGPKQLQRMWLCEKWSCNAKKQLTTVPPLSLLLELQFPKWQTLERHVQQLQH